MRQRNRHIEPSGKGTSRRTFLKATTGGLVAGAAFGPVLSGTAAAQDARAADGVQRVARQSREPRGRLLLRGGTVITMDPDVGDFLEADVLIEGRKILDVKPGIRDSARVIDARDMIVIPGLVDAHRHCWQNMFRRVIPNADGEVYGTFANSLIPAVRPQDVYIGNLISGLSAINSGVTCMLDVSHISKSAAHSDAAIQAHLDSGIRGVYGYAAPRSGASAAPQYPQDIHRIKKQFFSSADQLVSLRLAGGDVRLAREVGVGITMDGIFGMATPLRPNSAEARLLAMAKAGEFGPDLTIIHGTGFSEQVFRAVADNGVCMVLAVTSDGTLRGLGNSVAPIQGIIDHGLLNRTGLSVDVEVSLSPDLFAQMRAVFLLQRVLSNKRWAEGERDAPPPMTVRDVFTMATIGGARANGLIDRIGTLTPGKQADVVLIRANDITTGPLNHALGTVVVGAGTDNVDTVIIAGEVRKAGGRLVGISEDAIMRTARASRDFLAAATGLWKREDILRG